MNTIDSTTAGAAAGSHTTPPELALRAAAQQWLAAGRTAIDVCVSAHRGSVPRETGTHMLVSTAEVLGTVGGGHLELQAIEAARALLAAGPDALAALAATPRVWPIALGPSLGQCCGGHVTLTLRPLDAAALAGWRPGQPRLHLQLHGAGHVGRAIVRLLAGLNVAVQWVDEREAEFPPVDPHEPAHIERLCSDSPEHEVASAPPGSFFLVLTHSHELDLRITEAVLRRGDFTYCGLIGSQTKRARFLHRHEQRGIPPDTLARLTCPIGLPGITGKEPEVLAISVVAQLLQVAGAAQDGAGAMKAGLNRVAVNQRML
ncbi:xanthine dehydrogenase accessory protein XdhC [Leptothrix discophora]|uniref:Xanthine dehydrogenase accessory protein XdhC n=1 Tax=Leptothrix discophora TaxID=89 RepID=A0ABT9G931_LEPDI|nr:xanthine dehydrogenase accessory protein XdhC [Leptothrix discophora]MDP4302978.1 xanthine dehydrogenase accessory protein XdhC [Leptothrix discophora]